MRMIKTVLGRIMLKSKGLIQVVEYFFMVITMIITPQKKRELILKWYFKNSDSFWTDQK